MGVWGGRPPEVNEIALVAGQGGFTSSVTTLLQGLQLSKSFTQIQRGYNRRSTRWRLWYAVYVEYDDVTQAIWDGLIHQNVIASEVPTPFEQLSMAVTLKESNFITFDHKDKVFGNQEGVSMKKQLDKLSSQLQHLEAS